MTRSAVVLLLWEALQSSKVRIYVSSNEPRVDILSAAAAAPIAHPAQPRTRWQQEDITQQWLPLKAARKNHEASTERDREDTTAQRELTHGLIPHDL